jgi:GTP-binding protein EngB required for normal cell division
MSREQQLATGVELNSLQCGEGDGSHTLKNNHRLQVRLAFERIDSILTSVEQILVSPDRNSPFRRYRSDITPAQRKIASDYITRVREAMKRMMREQAIPFPDPVCGTRWAALTALLEATISAEELTPERLRGYGEVSLAGSGVLDRIRTELSSVLKNLQTYLEECATADLQERIAKIAKVKGNGLLIKQLDRIITAHGLVEHRNALAMTVDKLETATFEIGVFGRVSSGKSSLLNYLLGGNYLPVDVTPVTAVPVRISHGQPPRVEVEFADYPARSVQLPELWDFATEEGNPRNAKHVTQVQIKLRSPKLREGITFADTPGLGSLATSGSVETLTYLPRCDLGILMLEPSAGITAEDITVLDALGRAGSDRVILISKIDLFETRQRKTLLAYAAEQVQKQLSASIPIFPVSVVGEAATLCNRWLGDYLEPLLRRHQELAREAVSRKIAVLQNAVITSLESRLVRRSSAETQTKQRKRLAQSLWEVELLLENALRGSVELCRQVEDQHELIVKETTEEIVTGWLKKAPVAPDEILADKLSEILAGPISGIEESYRYARDQAARALENVEAASPKGLSLELPAALGMPPLDSAALAGALDLRKPAFLSVFTVPVMKQQLARYVRRQMDPNLRDFLRAYTKQLQNWFRDSVLNLQAAFLAAASIHRADFEPPAIQSSNDQAEIAADLQELKNGVVGASAPRSEPTELVS